MGDLAGAIVYLDRGLLIAEQTCQREDEARIRHGLGMALWQEQEEGNCDLVAIGAAAQVHLERSACLLEELRREANGSELKLRLFDLQSECYEVLQRLLVSMGCECEALVVAERARTRAFVDLLHERNMQAGSSQIKRKWEESIPKSVTEIINLVNRQKASVLYYSLAAGYLHIWLVVPNKGIVKFHQVRVSDENSKGKQ